MKREVYLFGDNSYALEIADALAFENRVSIYTQNEESVEKIRKNGYAIVNSFDLNDDVDTMFMGKNFDNILVFCALDSEAENLFLTISLRAAYRDILLIALARDDVTAKKLKLAGANKTIPFIQVTTDILTEILEQPYVTKVLHNILYEQSDLKLAEVRLKDKSVIIGEFIDEIQWHKLFAIKVIALSSVNHEIAYVYDKSLDSYTLKEDDILVVIGYDKDIKAFESKVGKSSEELGSYWRW